MSPAGVWPIDVATRCAGLHGNDWSSLVPEPGATWTPTARVSICIPTRNPGAGLARTLRCLDAQSYPADLIEIVIGDDRSDVPVVAPDDLRHHVTVVRCEHDLPFGAGFARHAAASAATGDILVFLDADVIPERQVIEAYARWFDRCPLVVPMGLCHFVDTDDVDDDTLVRLVSEGMMGEYFADAEVDEQHWRERHFDRLDDLRVESVDAFRITVGATLAVSSEQYAQVGGFPALGVRGVEDTVFGHRLHTNGAVLVLDRDATHWHQGRRNLSDPGTRERVNRIRAPYVESLMPIRGFRRADPPTDPPVDVVPVARVRIHGDGDATTRTRRSIDAQSVADVALADTPLAAEFDPAFVQVELPAGVRWSSTTAERIATVFRDHEVGVVRAVVDDLDGAIITIARSRAVRRARQVRPDDDPVAVAAELFGIWWIDAAALAIAPLGELSNAMGETTADNGDTDPDLSRWSSRLYDLLVAGLRTMTR